MPYSTCCYCLMFAFPLHACNMARYFIVHQASRSLESPEIWDCTLLSWPHVLIISPILGHYHTHEAIKGFCFALYLNTPLHMEDSFINWKSFSSITWRPSGIWIKKPLVLYSGACFHGSLLICEATPWSYHSPHYDPQIREGLGEQAWTSRIVSVCGGHLTPNKISAATKCTHPVHKLPFLFVQQNQSSLTNRPLRRARTLSGVGSGDSHPVLRSYLMSSPHSQNHSLLGPYHYPFSIVPQFLECTIHQDLEHSRWQKYNNYICGHHNKEELNIHRYLWTSKVALHKCMKIVCSQLHN